MRWVRAAVVAGVLALAAAPARAELVLPPGFTATVYVTGQGFHSDAGGEAPGVPAVSTLAVDEAGVLYFARTGRRYAAGALEDVWPIYRVSVGGARLTPATDAGLRHGPPLPNPQVAAIRGGREVLVTTYDRDRRVGVLYRMVGGAALRLAGGTPPRGSPPLLRQPEGVAVGPDGTLYVADREEGAVLRLDAEGRVRDSRWVGATRPRPLAFAGGRLWVGADREALVPWQTGPGAILSVGADGVPRTVLEGPVAADLAASPGGDLFVADRHAGSVFVLAPDGRRAEFLRFTDRDAPRALAFAPVTPATRQAGLAGDLLVVVIRRGAWPVNEIVRISGPFDDFVRGRLRY